VRPSPCGNKNRTGLAQIVGQGFRPLIRVLSQNTKPRCAIPANPVKLALIHMTLDQQREHGACAAVLYYCSVLDFGDAECAGWTLCSPCHTCGALVLVRTGWGGRSGGSSRYTPGSSRVQLAHCRAEGDSTRANSFLGTAFGGYDTCNMNDNCACGGCNTAKDDCAHRLTVSRTRPS
jgi:hypothetical protein